VAEKDQGCLEGLLLAPVDHTAIYFGKMISTVLFMLVVEALMLPVFTAFFGVNLFDLGLILVILLGTLGFAGVGTILSAMTAQTRAREVLLPILLLPVAAPVLIAAVKATSRHVRRRAARDEKLALFWRGADWSNLQDWTSLDQPIFKGVSVSPGTPPPTKTRGRR